MHSMKQNAPDYHVLSQGCIEVKGIFQNGEIVPTGLLNSVAEEKEAANPPETRVKASVPTMPEVPSQRKRVEIVVTPINLENKMTKDSLEVPPARRRHEVTQVRKRRIGVHGDEEIELGSPTLALKKKGKEKARKGPRIGYEMTAIQWLLRSVWLRKKSYSDEIHL
ncbi:hypothetical protein BS50DRAFT_34708 [Corynespora cassiicola Philippines]|uniref:Uncharacterized protein n=1 Tax=Corynespora cassiicola Philippines TaxID=1448308 RepID=A0A2T2PCE5_CORCC|nr:hypothetical protein BS50DRAFT_34708 [Corynespora cassiicola Philippines]